MEEEKRIVIILGDSEGKELLAKALLFLKNKRVQKELQLALKETKVLVELVIKSGVPSEETRVTCFTV